MKKLKIDRLLEEKEAALQRISELNSQIELLQHQCKHKKVNTESNCDIIKSLYDKDIYHVHEVYYFHNCPTCKKTWTTT